MSDKDNISEEEITKEAPILFGLPKRDLQAPEGYFDSLSDRIMDKIKSNNQIDPIEFNEGSQSSVLLWAIAAGIAVLAGLFIINGDHESISPTDYSSELSIDLDEDLEYLMEFEEDIILETYLAEETSENESEEFQFLMEEDFDYEDYINVDL